MDIERTKPDMARLSTWYSRKPSGPGDTPGPGAALVLTIR